MEKTYLLGLETIQCLLCMKTSSNREDVRNRYCGWCHIFHADLALVRNMHKDGATHVCGDWKCGAHHDKCAVCGKAVGGG